MRCASAGQHPALSQNNKNKKQKKQTKNQNNNNNKTKKTPNNFTRFLNSNLVTLKDIYISPRDWDTVSDKTNSKMD